MTSTQPFPGNPHNLTKHTYHRYSQRPGDGNACSKNTAELTRKNSKEQPKTTQLKKAAKKPPITKAHLARGEQHVVERPQRHGGVRGALAPLEALAVVAHIHIGEGLQELW